MARRMVVGMIMILAVAACGTATVSGHVYWPSCPSGSPGCPTVEGVPVHYRGDSDAANPSGAVGAPSALLGFRASRQFSSVTPKLSVGRAVAALVSDP